MESYLGMRKGKWTAEEDNLLRKCIGKYGEGKWHQVPLKAGLNRCRKSCRLRWLNYLKPNLKRGEFAEDEVDLIIRLHKLLGNRWSLIAGRIPGRTANDVKNYWNTRRRKTEYYFKKDLNEKYENVTKINVIKPQPRAFSKNYKGKSTIINDHINTLQDNHLKPIMMSPLRDSEVNWWESLLADNESKQILGDALIEENQSSWSGFSIDVDLWNFPT